MVLDFIVEQKKFRTLEEFMAPEYEGMNNFYIHFVDLDGNIQRERPVVARFNSLFPGLSRKLTSEVTRLVKQYRAGKIDNLRESLPHEKLWFAYECISAFLVASYVRDPYGDHADRYLTS